MRFMLFEFHLSYGKADIKYSQFAALEEPSETNASAASTFKSMTNTLALIIVRWNQSFELSRSSKDV
jgi:hypothetical protein